MTRTKLLASISPIYGCPNPSRSQSKDFYPTPGYVTLALTERETFDGMIWEPACGEGHMSDALKAALYPVFSTDIEKRGYCGQYEHTIDFLQTNVRAQNIVTNPPFELAHEFVLQAKELAVRKIAMLLRLQWLEGQKRFKEIWTDTEFPLKKILVFSQRVNLALGTVTEQNGSQVAYAWFIWDKEHTGSPTIEWIAPNT